MNNYETLLLVVNNMLAYNYEHQVSELTYIRRSKVKAAVMAVINNPEINFSFKSKLWAEFNKYY